MLVFSCRENMQYGIAPTCRLLKSTAWRGSLDIWKGLINVRERVLYF
jgi:hypothetical protein